MLASAWLAARVRAAEARVGLARVLLRAVEPARRALELLRAAGLAAGFAPVFVLRGNVVSAGGILRVLLFFLATARNGYGCWSLPRSSILDRQRTPVCNPLLEVCYRGHRITARSLMGEGHDGHYFVTRGTCVRRRWIDGSTPTSSRAFARATALVPSARRCSAAHPGRSTRVRAPAGRPP